MAKVNTSAWDPEDLRALEVAGVDWGNAYQDNDEAGMERAHEAAELIRAKYGYTGGADGSSLQALPKAGSTQQPAQTQRVGGTTVATPSQYTGWQPADNSGNNYAQMSGMSELHQAALEAAGNSWNEAYKAGNQAGMDAAHQQAEAIRALYGYSGGNDGSQYVPAQKPAFNWDVPAPTLNDSYADRINAMYDQLMNYGPFSYDAESDPTFRQYKDMYTREGQRAMQNTLGQVSARTGGLASSYALSAAQQTNNYYMQQLADKIPELRQLAYEMYMGDYDQQVQQLGLLQTAQKNEYERYLDEYDKWKSNRDFAYGQYWDDYTASQDLIDRTYDQNIADRDYKDLQEKTAYERGITEQEAAYNQALEWLQAGAMPREDILAAAGITGAEAAAYLESMAAKKKLADPEPEPEPLETWHDGMVDDGDYYTDTETGISHPKEVYGKDLMEYSDAAGNYQEVATMAADIYSKEGRTAAINYLDEALKLGALNVTDYSQLKKKYRDMPVDK